MDRSFFTNLSRGRAKAGLGRTTLWSGLGAVALVALFLIGSLGPAWAASSAVKGRNGWSQEADLLKKLGYSLQKSGQDKQAMEVYRKLLRSGRADRDVLVRYTWLLNKHKQYSRAWSVISRLKWPHEYLSVLKLQAQTAFWAKQYGPAERLYAELVHRRPADNKLRSQYAKVIRERAQVRAAKAGATAKQPPKRRTEADRNYEQASRLLDSNRANQALAPARAAVEAEPKNRDFLLLAARAADGAGYPLEAAQYLDRLGRERTLTAEEMVWLGGLYRRTEKRRQALTAYEQTAKLYPNHLPMRVWEAIGDLRWELDDFKGSLAAYQRTAKAYDQSNQSPPPSLHLKLARSAAKAKETDLAAEQYTKLVELEPDNIPQVLEAARYLSMIGRVEKAAAYFEIVAQAKPDPEIWLETGQALVMAKQYRAAEKWTAKAMEAGVRPDLTPFVHAQALHYQGKTREADAVLRAFREKYPNNAEALALSGYVSSAMDRNLEAYNLFDRAVAAGAPRQAELRLWQGISAGKRKDYKRAYDSLAQAREQGVDKPLADELESQLDRQTRAKLEPVGSFMQDSNDMELWNIGGEAYFYAGGHLPIGLRYRHGQVKQDRDGPQKVDFDRDSLVVFMPRFYLAPQWQLEWFAGAERLDESGPYDEEYMWLGSVDLRYKAEDDSHIGVIGRHGNFWTEMDSSDPKRWNRIIDLSRIAPSFAITGVEGYFLKNFYASPVGNWHWQVNGGYDWYEDDNSRAWVYTHIQAPVINSSGNWLAVKPNFYGETYKDRQEAYFSPDEYAALGLMLHYIGDADLVKLEMEVNPQLQYSSGDWGFGGHGMASLTLNLNPIYPGIGLFGFYDENDDYWLWRAVATLGVRF